MADSAAVTPPPGFELEQAVAPPTSGLKPPPGFELESSGQSAATNNPPQQGLWDRVKSSLSSHALADEGRANYYKKGGDVGAPGSSEGPGLMEGLADYDKASGGEVGGGVHDILQGNVAKGLHRIISGVGSGVAPMAAMAAPAALATAPVSTALSVGGGVVGSKVAGAAAQGLGASPDQQALAEDVGGLAGGYAGAKIPSAAGKAALLGKTPEEAYQSALKPSTTINPAVRDRAIQTGLQERIPVNSKGLEAISDRIDDLNQQIADKIKTGAAQGATVDPNAVASRLADVRARFANQVNPNADLAAIDSAKAEFLQNHPNTPQFTPGKPLNPGIPIDEAQAMKQGTYRVLSGKYGEQGSASTEAQKALARGLKEEIATNFPEINDLNTAESRLLDLKPLLEKAVARISNHQLLGVGTPVAAGAAKAVSGSNKVGAAAGLLKAVLDDPAIKSRLAISLSRAGLAPANSIARISAYQASLGYLAGGHQTASSDDTPNQEIGAQP